MSARPAVFLDRDGTMIHEAGYLGRIEDLRWFPWTVDAIRLLNRAGFLVFVVSNQGGVARGKYKESDVEKVHQRIAGLMSQAANGARIEALRVDCDCRKPKPGLVRQAAAAFDIDLARSFVVGDKLSDVDLARGVGARGVLVRTGYGDDVVQAHAGVVPGAAHVAADLMAATAWLLDASDSERRAS
jgi:D-glycero-D-manno-heptose 1,7-bisphosphate phosphatase